MTLESQSSSTASTPRPQTANDSGVGAVFLDRDGILIEDRSYLTSFKQVQLIEDAVESVHRINHTGLIPIVVSNQSAIGRGMLTREALEEIHRFIDREFRLNGARIDAFYYCPHHPEAKQQEFRVNCDCRKPKPGMLLRAAREWNIDLSKSYMIGDSSRDVEAGKAAGCRTILIRDPSTCSHLPDFSSSNLLDGVNWILEQ